MSEGFDPYYRWLGIPPKEQPPNHYRLLGLELFEADPVLIDSFALRHTSFLRNITDGPHLPDAQRLLNELAAARRCLLDPQRKAAYDDDLRARLAAVGTLHEDALKEGTGTATNRGPAPEPGQAVAEPVPFFHSTPARTPSRPQRRRMPVGVVAGAIGTAGALLAVLAATVYLLRPEAPRSAPAAAGAQQPPAKAATGATRVAGRLQTSQLRRTASPEPAPSVPPAPRVAAPSVAAPPVAASAEAPASEPSSSAPNEATLEAAPAVSFIPDGQPPRLPGLVLWLDASTLAPADTRIARWSDGSDGRYVAVQKQEDRRPELLLGALHGKPVARFRGGPWLEIPGTSQALDLRADYTIAYVARGVGGTLLSKGSGGKEGQFSLLSDSCFLTNGDLNASTAGRLAATDDDPAQFRVRAIAADAAALTWYIDGTAGGSYADDRHEVENKSVVRIGAPAFRADREDVSQLFVGDLAELLIYNRALPEAERWGVEAYLREKWLSGGEPAVPLDLVAASAEPPAAEPAPAEPPAAEKPVPVNDPPPPGQAGGNQPSSAHSGRFTLFVNLGGGPWQDPAGNDWVPSKDFDGATFGHEAGQAVKSDAADHPLYGTAVRKLTGFRAVVPDGEYRVELHFHEHWSRNPASRSFVVAVEQQPVLRPGLFFEGPGMGQPYVHAVNKVIVKDGRLDVDLIPTSPGSLTILNGIAIWQLR